MDPMERIREPCTECKGAKVRSTPYIGEMASNSACESCDGIGLRWPSLSEPCHYARRFPGFHDDDGCPDEELCHDGRVSVATEGLVLELLFQAHVSLMISVMYLGGFAVHAGGSGASPLGTGPTLLSALLAALPEA